MNDIIVDKIETIKYEDTSNSFDSKDVQIREEFSINQSFRRGYSSLAQIMEVPTYIIELMNCWKKIEKAKGRKHKFSKLETYVDVEILIPKLVQYSAQL